MEVSKEIIINKLLFTVSNMKILISLKYNNLLIMKGVFNA